MIVRTGFQTFEFQQLLELTKPLSFDRDGEALNWLKHLWSQHPDLIRRFREYLARFSRDQEVFRLTDHQAIERLAVLLHTRRIVVVARESRAGGGTPTPHVEIAAPPFPLSERKRRVAPVYYGASTHPAEIVVAPLWIRLDLTQKQAANETGSLWLVGSTGYDKTLAIAGNFVANAVEANTVDVLFENVPTEADYTLAYVAADGTKTRIVQGASFDSLKDESMAAPAAEPQS